MTNNSQATKSYIPDAVLSIGLKKAAIVLHALAFKLDDKYARDETLALVTIVADAAYRLEKKE